MNGPHDLGGRDGFGPVLPEENEPNFHAPWEARVLGMTLCAGILGHWNLDSSRHARESLPPVIYLGTSYYEIWLRALEALLLRFGEVTEEELAAGKMLQPGLRPERKMTADKVFGVLSKGGPVTREADTMPRFAPGDVVRTSHDVPAGHTRLPSYARDKVGKVIACHGAHVFPDSNARGDGEAPQILYTVLFDGDVLWGSRAEPGSSVTINAWESYLAPA